MPFFLQEIKNQIEEVAGFSFNAVLLNYYRDERDSMGWHSDDEPEMNQTMIASLSLGAERVFKFRHKASKQKLQVKLTSGSLLLMKNFQENWQHAIDKSTKPIGGRINLTFRQII
jgi:alkylated DNA repair dioxygenase AlkB